MKNYFKRLAAISLAISCTFTTIFATDYQASTPEEFFGYMGQSLENMEEEFSITYTGDAEDLVDDKVEYLEYAGLAILQRAFAAGEESSSNGDYIAYNISSGLTDISDDVYSFLDMEYLNSAEQKEYIESEVVRIIEGLELDDDDDITKIKKIYQYMTTNFVYDSTLSLFSAYDGLTTGTMVCQGYAILTDYLMEKAGINCRVVTGLSQFQNHAWNMVEYNDEWYFIDTTWDATSIIGQSGKYDYFMKSTEDFVGHAAFEAYTTEVFEENYPIASESYPIEIVEISSSTGALSSLIMRKDISEVELLATLPDGTTAEDFEWVISNSEVLNVTEDGMLTAVGLGSAYVSIISEENPNWISNSVNVIVIEMSSVSNWAYDDVTSYYLEGLVPYTLCSDYQNGITREELAVLCDYLIINTSGYAVLENPTTSFVDISELEYTNQLSIMRCFVAGIMNGTGDEEFEPNEVVTREQAAAVLVRLFEYILDTECSSLESLSFSDYDDISEWAVEEISKSASEGLLLGNADGTFEPLEEMTREQMFVTLLRVLSSYKEVNE